MLTDALDHGHLLCISSLRRFQDGNDGAIRVLTSDGSDDGFVVGGEAICTIVLTVADNCKIIIHIIFQSHCPNITGVRGIATHGDVCERHAVAIGLSQVVLKKSTPAFFALTTFCNRIAYNQHIHIKAVY